jgi:signal transduction histidine kinase
MGKLDRLSRVSVCYQFVSFLIASCISWFIISRDQTLEHVPLAIVFLVYQLGYVVTRVCLNKSPILQGLLVLQYFFVLLIGYYLPILSWYEFLFLPCILLEFVLLFPFTTAMVLEVVRGMTGAIVVSHHLISTSIITMREFSFPLSLLSFCFYPPISLAFILVAIIRHARQREEAHLAQVEDLNHRLEGINHNINQKLFGIQQDSSQKERMRITKEIHDTAGYVFINVIMLLQTAMAVLDSDRKLGEAKINDALDYTRRGMNEIRYILREMRAYEKPSLGLQNELYEVADLFMKATEVKVKMEYGNWPRSLGRKLDMFFISFLQESLTNALKHGHASCIDMLCWENSSGVMMLVKDNGVGSQGPINPGIGLSGIRDFVKGIQGTVEVGSDETGFLIRVSIPHDSVLKLQQESDSDGERAYYGLENV